MATPTKDTVEPCPDHSACIRVFKDRSSVSGFAGWWHFAWKGDAEGWELTAPDGKTHMAPPREGEHPVGWLVGAVPGIAFHEMAAGISKKGLFPP